MVKKKILHFEDEVYMAEMYGLLLKQSGFAYQYYPHPPATAAELIELVASAKPDVIIMDIMMPMMDGYQATRIIKENPVTADIPVIGLCNVWQVDEIKKALAVGMTDYLGKVHYIPSEIVGIIKEFLSDPDHYRPRCQQYL
jgi:CheY-like chemotaxis protein